MKIAIVCGHFIPEMGYIEVHLAKSLSELGHEVAVYTSTEIPKYVRHLIDSDFEEGVEDLDNFIIHRLKPSFSLGQMVKSPDLKNQVLKYAPDLVICIGLGKLFPEPIFEIKSPNFQIVTLLGDNEETYASGNNWQQLKNYILRQKFKRNVYRKAIVKSNILISYTPATFKVLSEFIPAVEMENLKMKHSEISLGFSPEEFFYDENLRKQKRTELNIPENVKVVITATRVSPAKQFENLPMYLKGIKTQFFFILIGLEDNPYGEIVKTAFHDILPAESFLLKPFAKRNELNAWYNAADSAFFNTAAISNFEALGTGLPLVLPNQLNLCGILTSGFNGEYYEKPNPSAAINGVLNYNLNIQSRKERSKIAADKFSWKSIAVKIIDSIKVQTED